MLEDTMGKKKKKKNNQAFCKHINLEHHNWKTCFVIHVNLSISMR